MRRGFENACLILVAQATCAGFCGTGGGDIPEVDACDDPGASSSITGIELGTRDENVFTPLENGSAENIVFGGQGAAMLPFRARITGSGLPECVEMKVELRSGDEQLINLVYSLNTHEESDGSRTIKPLFLILGQPPPNGARGDLHVEVFGQKADRSIKFTNGDALHLRPTFDPSTGAVASGGTAILSLRTEWTSFDPLPLENILAGLSAPAAIPGGTEVSFRIRAAPDLLAGTRAELTVQHETETAGVEIFVIEPREPAMGDLVFREVLVPTAAGFANLLPAEGDANCDGAVDPRSDQFIELLNRAAAPITLDGVQLSERPSSLYLFPPIVLGPGEVIVVFSGALGGAEQNSAARCASFGAGGRVGDAAVLGDAGFELRGVAVLSVETREQREVNSVELTRAFELRTSLELVEEQLTAMIQPELAPRSSSLPFTPGLNSDAEPFADVNP
jgi:hypothetical protein